ncbi:MULTISPECIES: Sec-independent protein translocase protein TatB [unclassified Sulfitobacter]|jgi:sec-independent protein translocase protein TatB|uniref:Sec-independent protein translocase protein TatB n=1 Tax=unclassified Sulfitobacter TaxID=196795 RepID=UPI0015934BC2|nr:Sec-independent protein translocase protein TatB [Sulfitobacter sp. HGT1]MBQ0803466.1 twin-arginine translocase subunit TatB [Sulfitobacter sp.]
MFDMGWSELLVVGVVALIVVGPKDLPVLFRKVGQFVGKAKGMAREFSSAMNDAADDTGMREISSGLNKSLKAATNPLGTAMDGVKSATKSLADINPDSETGKLAAKRAEDAKKMQAVRDRTIAERKQREAKEALAAADAEVAHLAKPATPAAKPAAAKKTPAKKPAAPKAAAAKKPAAKPAAKKPAAKKPAAKKSET